MSFALSNHQAILLTKRGQSEHVQDWLEPQVLRWLSSVDAAYESSDSKVASVSPEGVVTAMTDVGSTWITATAGDGRQYWIPVVVAKLAKRSFALSREQIKSTSNDFSQATLLVDEVTTELREGDIVVGRGLFGRITDHREAAGEIHVQTELVSLPEVFDSIRFRVTSVGDS